MVQQRGENEEGGEGGGGPDGESGAARPQGDPLPSAQPSLARSRLDASLKGQLPCIQCGYELQGVSILGVCPECGTAVRATLLAVIDPLATELQPIEHPRRVAAGLLMWIGAFCAAALMFTVHLVRQVYVAWHEGALIEPPAWQGVAAAALVITAGVGALLIARPHAHMAGRGTLLARIGAAVHVPLAASAALVSTLQAGGATGAAGGWGPRSGLTSIGPLAALWEPAPERSLWRLAAGAAGIAVIILMRPVTRILVARSLAIRTGRVDRQTLLATGAAIAVVMVGDAMGLLARTAARTGPTADWLYLAAVIFLAFGTVLLLMGLFSSLVDGVRIARAIVRPGPSMHQVVHGEPPAGPRTNGGAPPP